MNKTLFLDRDGVINIDYGYTHKISEFEFVEGIIPLCQLAIEKEYQIVVITNQSGIARGMYGHEEVETLHAHMKLEFAKEGVKLNAIYYCPHHPEKNGLCFCRKPGSLLFERALAKFETNPKVSWMIGDSERDLIPAQKFGIKTVLVGKKFSEYANICVDKLPDMYAYL